MVTWTMKLVTVIFTLCLISPGVFAEDAKIPAWCQKGWVCVTTAEMADRTALVWELQAERTLLKMRARRFGFTVGCGVGIAGVVDQNFQTRTAPALSCGAYYGLRF